MTRFLFFLAFCCFANFACAQTTTDTLKPKRFFELSFGQSVLFISDSKVINIRNQSAVVVPTSAILFFAEFRPDKIMRIPVFFNLPTESKQFLVNGQLVNEKSNPTFGTGLEFRLFKLGLDAKSSIELEVGPLASVIIPKGKMRVLPLIAGRVRIRRGENFVMYVGGSYSFGINTFGLLYGTGTIF
ncbi:MAG: hypothetical protein ACRCYO_14790 [Bacteroidia bacterium]